jgi:hypothetical protein
MIMKKFDPTPKTIEVLLHAFYENTIFTDDGVEICRSSEPYDKLIRKYNRKDEYGYNNAVDGYSDIEDIPMNIIIEAYNKIPDKELYKNIKLAQTYDRDGYKSEPCIVGYRLERPDEVEERKRKYDEAVLAEENEKLAKKQKALENAQKTIEAKKKQLEKLKKELE